MSEKRTLLEEDIIGALEESVSDEDVLECDDASSDEYDSDADPEYFPEDSVQLLSVDEDDEFAAPIRNIERDIENIQSKRRKTNEDSEASTSKNNKARRKTNTNKSKQDLKPDGIVIVPDVDTIEASPKYLDLTKSEGKLFHIKDKENTAIFVIGRRRECQLLIVVVEKSFVVNTKQKKCPDCA
ncbi:hypothetical protein J6590_043954 [Homalodisca vitripennis]|nr:hypothetical protein J6590_043954 [Homalodisca vitripennis]